MSANFTSQSGELYPVKKSRNILAKYYMYECARTSTFCSSYKSLWLLKQVMPNVFSKLITIVYNSKTSTLLWAASWIPWYELFLHLLKMPEINQIICSVQASRHQHKASSFIVLQSPFHNLQRNNLDTAKNIR